MKHRWTFSIVILALAGFLKAPVAIAQNHPGAVPIPHPIPALTPAATPDQLPMSEIDSVLKWDAEIKEVSVTNGTPHAEFTFSLTNISKENIIISGVRTSCGCTVAKLPEQPWKLIPGTNGEIHVTMNLANKFGLVTKTITVSTDEGTKMLFVKANIQPSPVSEMGNRQINQKLALADRQAVFRGDCARCHTVTKDESGKELAGRELYASVCGVCHEAEHRATMVPDLHRLPHDTSPEYWRTWIAHGKEGTLMPAFSEKNGGILNNAQIELLVAYLNAVIPTKAQARLVRPIPQPH
jgi:mono/diheme cytochrome c family protein